MSGRPGAGGWLAGAVIVAALLGAARPASAAPTVVALIGGPDDRLAEEVGRELALARFVVVRVDLPAGAPGPSGADQPGGVPADVPAGPALGVLVAPDDRRVVVFARQGAAAGLHTRIEMQVDPHDRLARRRACLAAVEYLRVLAEGARFAPAPADEPAAPPIMAAPPLAAPSPSRESSSRSSSQSSSPLSGAAPSLAPAVRAPSAAAAPSPPRWRATRDAAPAAPGEPAA